MSDGDTPGQWAAEPADPVPPPPPPAPLAASPPPPVAGTGLDPRADVLGLGAPSRWRSLDGLRTALVVLLGCSAAASVAVVVALVNRIGVVDDIEAGRFGLDIGQRATNADDAVGATITISAVFWLATAVVFIIWQWRSAKNAELLGRDGARFGPGWSIGGWFIPFANFVIPVLVIQDLWPASSPGARPGTWRTERASALVGWWWALFLISGLAARTLDNDTDSLAEIREVNERGLFAFGLTIVAAVLAIMLVLQLTRRFDDRRSEL